VGDGITWDGLEVVLKSEDTEIRRTDEGGLAICLLRLARGAHTAPVFVGLPGDRCQCPHWGHIIRGAIRVHTADGARTFEEGESYFWAPGHNLEALTDCEYLEISPAADYDALMAHVARRAGL
jgi:hypothetical protein